MWDHQTLGSSTLHWQFLADGIIHVMGHLLPKRYLFKCPSSSVPRRIHKLKWKCTIEPATMKGRVNSVLHFTHLFWRMVVSLYSTVTAICCCKLWIAQEIFTSNILSRCTVCSYRIYKNILLDGHTVRNKPCQSSCKPEARTGSKGPMGNKFRMCKIEKDEGYF